MLLSIKYFLSGYITSLLTNLFPHLRSPFPVPARGIPPYTHDDNTRAMLEEEPDRVYVSTAERGGTVYHTSTAPISPARTKFSNPLTAATRLHSRGESASGVATTPSTQSTFPTAGSQRPSSISPKPLDHSWLYATASRKN